MTEYLILYFLMGMATAEILNALGALFILPFVDDHAGEEELPTDCIPRDEVDDEELGI